MIILLPESSMKSLFLSDIKEYAGNRAINYLFLSKRQYYSLLHICFICECLRQNNKIFLCLILFKKI